MKLFFVFFIILLTNTSFASLSFSQHKEICDAGGFESCNLLGYSYSIGMKVKQDYSKSYEYYRKSCDGENGNGCFGLALLYYTDVGLEENISKAKSLFYKGCDLRHKASCDWYKSILSEEDSTK